MSETQAVYAIEKGVSVPPRMPTKRGSKYPFKDMDVGDSFFVPNPEGSEDIANRLRNAAHRFGTRYGYKFSIRNLIEGEDQVQGVRVWRSA